MDTISEQCESCLMSWMARLITLEMEVVCDSSRSILTFPFLNIAIQKFLAEYRM